MVVARRCRVPLCNDSPPRFTASFGEKWCKFGLCLRDQFECGLGGAIALTSPPPDPPQVHSTQRLFPNLFPPAKTGPSGRAASRGRQR